MKPRHLLPLLAVALPLHAEDLLPIQVPVTQYAKIWEECPFNREVAKVVESQVTSTFGKNLTLDGVSHDSIVGPIVYVRDLSTNQPLMITKSESAAHPFTIVTANETNDPRDAKVTITNGEEVTELLYQSDLMTRTIEQTAPPVATEPAPQSSQQKARATGLASPDTPSSSDQGASAPGAAEPVDSNSPEQVDVERRNRILLPPRAQN